VSNIERALTDNSQHPQWAYFQNESGLFGRCRKAGNLGSPARYCRGAKECERRKSR
jgi:hypothetical protein